MANTIATSTLATATAYSASQRVAISARGDSLVLWHDGTNVKWSYASSPYSTWTTATLTVSTKTQYALYKLANDDVLAVVAQSTNMVSYYFTYNAGAHSWSVGGAVTVLAAGVGTNGGNLGMDMDAQGRIWAAWESGTTTTQVYNTANNGTSWSASTTFAEVSGGAANAVALAYIGNYIVVTTCATAGAGVLYYARIDAHSAGLGSWSTPAAVTNAAADNAVSTLCLRGVPGSNLGVLADDEYTALPTQRYDANADTWSTVTNIGSASDKNPTLVGNGTDLYCVWSKQTAANNFSLVYKKWTTASQTWDAASTELEANGTNISYVGGGYGFGLLAFVYTVGTANPWSVNFDTKVFVQQTPDITKRLYMPDGTPRALGGTIIPQVILPPVIYEPRALGSTLLTDSRIFIPRALGGVYIQDDPTEMWLPRIMAGTTQVSASVALSSTQQGIGTLGGTLTLATALTDTIPGLGVLTPTLTAKLDLGSTTLVAIGVFTPASFTESTALTDTLPAVGVLSGTLLASLGLSTTIPGVGTLTGTFTESTVLTVTIPAVGTLTGTLSTSTNVSLSVTIPAVGTLTMAGAALSTALTDTINAVGSLNPALSASIALASVSIPAIGTIAGTLGASAPLTSTVVGVGTINATMGESTSLTVSVSVVGTLTGTLTVGNSVSLAVTIPGVGTLTAAAPGFKTALVVSIAGLGTISPGATFSEALSGTTLVAAGTISGSVSLAVILGTALTGLGTISGAFQVRTALSVQFMALGTILGTIRVPATFFGPYGATEVVSSKLTSSHTVTSKISQHVASSYTATRK